MELDTFIDKIIFNKESLSEVGREAVIYEILDIYDNMKNPKFDLNVYSLAKLSDKDLILTLISASEYNAVKYFLENSITTDQAKLKYT